MINNCYFKYLVFTIFILFVGSGVIGSVNSISLNEDYSGLLDYNRKSILNTDVRNPLKIENIKGGMGIFFVLKNDGDLDILDIRVDIEVTEGLIKIKTPTPITISKLEVGNSTNVRIRVFGFEFGEPFEYNRIIITLSAPNIKTMKRIIVANVFGSVVTINAVFSNDEGAYEGYTLFSPEYSTSTYLINNSGEIVKSWKSNYIQGLGLHLLQNGSLLRTGLPKINTEFTGGGITGRVEMSDWNGTLLWEYELTNNQRCLHHDIKPLPNGNILMTAWEYKSASEAISKGRNPLTIPLGKLWPSFIIEVKPTLPIGGDIVWEWHVWDHLIQDYDSSKNNYGVVADHPELIDINYEGSIIGVVDYNHINSIDYNEKFDQILLSSYTQNEIWIIDHSTTTEEAAGHTGGRYEKGGDLLYRWGNPQAYRARTADDQKFFSQHDARWIKTGYPGEGNILVFNNGFLRPGPDFSSVVELVPPVDSNGNYYLEPGEAYGPKDPVWIYTADSPTDFYAYTISGSERLPNGNTLICDGNHGIFFQVTPDKEIVWRYVNLFPDLVRIEVFKTKFYPLDYPGLGEFDHKEINRVIEKKQVSISNLINNKYDFKHVLSDLAKNIDNFLFLTKYLTLKLH